MARAVRAERARRTHALPRSARPARHTLGLLPRARLQPSALARLTPPRAAPRLARRTLCNNLVTGVSVGFEKKLTLIGVGYRAAVEGTKKLTLSLGLSHPVELPIPAGLAVKARARAGARAAAMHPAAHRAQGGG